MYIVLAGGAPIFGLSGEPWPFLQKKDHFLAAIAALYVTMSVGLSVGPSVCRSVCLSPTSFKVSSNDAENTKHRIQCIEYNA